MSSLSSAAMPKRSLHVAIFSIVLAIQGTNAHEHHAIEAIDTAVPIDATLYIHMGLQTIVWGVMFPVGMVLGLSKSRWHVPTQATALLLTLVGYFLGHHHHGREFPSSVHGIMAKILTYVMILMACLGTFLKLHIYEQTFRPYVVKVHGFIGKFFPVLGWTQMLFGVATAFGYCRGGHLGQCAAHYIMGSAFIGYGAILAIMLHLGGAWLARTGRSQEMFDSIVISIFGVINTFTEHHGGPWTHKDLQHTFMGVLWWAGGMLGMWLSRGGRRSFVPAVIIIMTGWGMSAHEQSLMLSTKIHGLFGYALMAAGVTRLIEVCFVLGDQPTPEGVIRIFQHLPPYLLVLGGTLFMSATDEELHNADDHGIDHVTYALFDFSLSFLLYLLISVLIHLYTFTGKNGVATAEAATQAALASQEAGYARVDEAESFEMTSTLSEGEEDAMKIEAGEWHGRKEERGQGNGT